MFNKMFDKSEFQLARSIVLDLMGKNKHYRPKLGDGYFAALHDVLIMNKQNGITNKEAWTYGFNR